MNLVLVLFIFIGSTCTVNRISHGKDFERKHPHFGERSTYPKKPIFGGDEAPIRKRPSELPGVAIRRSPAP